MNATESKTYDGWANYETWNVKLCQDNDRESYEYWRTTARKVFKYAEADSVFTKSERARCDLADRLKKEVEEASPLVEVAGMYSDLLGAALSDVDWDEIAESWLEDSVDYYEPRPSRRG